VLLARLPSRQSKQQSRENSAQKDLTWLRIGAADPGVLPVQHRVGALPAQLHARSLSCTVHYPSTKDRVANVIVEEGGSYTAASNPLGRPQPAATKWMRGWQLPRWWYVYRQVPVAFLVEARHCCIIQSGSGHNGLQA